MAFANQFSLSLELTKLIPLGPLISSAGRGLAGLVRELQVSGSDIITEQDLAEVFGRNRIEPLFASTFRTAVKQSLIHKVSDIAELVIEAGAGPTVRRSLNEPAYFSTVVQLSLLSWTHDLSHLANTLSIALERRIHGAVDYIALPNYDALKGTLRACREQTSGFMWELIISAVDEQLADNVGTRERYGRRPVPIVILQALLDSFTAVQHLPEHTLLRIRTILGVPTIVVWAHHVLGLTVAVETNRSVIRFGPGSEAVYIDCRADDNQFTIAEASLLNETHDLIFHLVESEEEDRFLIPAVRHPVLGYGNRILELEIYEVELWEAFVYEIVTSCISLVQQEFDKRAGTDADSKGKDKCPSTHHVLAVSKILFPKHASLLDSLDLKANQPCHLRAQTFPDAYQVASGSPRQILLRLAHAILVLSMVANLTNCEGLSLDIRTSVIRKECYDPFHLPDAREAFNSVASLIRGPLDSSGDELDKRTAVISAWGWSLCVGSITCHDPSELDAGLAVYQGVPMRRGERKRLILDSFSSYAPVRNYQNHSRLEHHNNYVAVANPGERLEMTSWAIPKRTRNLISATEKAFEVSKIYRCEPDESDGFRRVSDSVSEGEEIRLGFRCMQELYWDAVHITNCDHSAFVGQLMTVPPDTWAFRGFGEPTRASQRSDNWTGSSEGSMHIGLVAGNTPARWILLNSMLQMWRSFESLGALKVYVRSPDCCLDCAVKTASGKRTIEHVGLVL